MRVSCVSALERDLLLLLVNSTNDFRFICLHAGASLHCALSLAAQCIVIGPVCLCVGMFVCLWVCYHDNSKLRASIFTKLGL